MKSEEFTRPSSIIYLSSISDPEKTFSFSNSVIKAFSACSILEVDGIIPSKSLRLAIAILV
jgi:hypothetical protein